MLLVEDNLINIEVAQTMLQTAGFRVDVSHNGADALKKLREQAYDVVLMDLEMPVMDGLEATRALRKGEAGTLNQETPVIAVTAHALPEFEEKARLSGMQDFITKPISKSLLLQRIEQILV